MNAAQGHLVAVHLPVVGCLFSTLILVFAWIRGQEPTIRAAYLLYILCALLGAVAYYTGPFALEVLETYGPVDTPIVEDHALLGRASFVGLVLLGVLSLQALLQYLQGSRPATWVRWAVLLTALALCYLLAWTAHVGGEIRHPEIRQPRLAIFPEVPR